MSNFQEPDYVSEFEPIRNEFGQAMFGSNWLEFANYRDGDVELPPYMLDRNAMRGMHAILQSCVVDCLKRMC